MLVGILLFHQIFLFFIFSEKRIRICRFSCHMSVMEFDSAQPQKYDEKDFEMIEMSDDAKRELEMIKEIERKKKGGVDLVIASSPK